jgi:hypothetical protein
MPNKKIIIAPSNRIADFWIRSMGLRVRDVVVLTPYSLRSFRGLLKEDVYAFIYEETFDYPERNHPKFTSFCEAVENYLGVN